MKRKLLIGALASSLLVSTANASMMGGSTTPPPGQAIAAPMGGTYLNVKIPPAIQNLPLTTADGKSISLASLKGQTIVISNFLTSCQEICPMTTVNLQHIADAVNSTPLKSKVTVLEISVDAGRDTPSRMSAYQALYGEKSWTLATGTEKNLNTLWTFFGAPATKSPISAADAKKMPNDWQTGKKSSYDMTHSDIVMIIGADGSWRWLQLGMPATKDHKIPAKLLSFLTADGQQNLKSPDSNSWSVDSVLAALSALTGSKVKA